MTHLRVSDLPLSVQKKILKKIALEEQRITPGHTSASKYHAEKATCIMPDGTEHTFDSRKEAEIYSHLRIREKAGEITDLKIQVPYELIPKQKRADGTTERNCRYIADFVYNEGGRTIVLDCKGYRKGTAYSLFVIKRKLMLFLKGIEVQEV